MINRMARGLFIVFIAVHASGCAHWWPWGDKRTPALKCEMPEAPEMLLAPLPPLLPPLPRDLPPPPSPPPK